MCAAAQGADLLGCAGVIDQGCPVSQIWVDADAAPRPCKDILYRAAQRRSVTVTLVANQWMQVPGGRVHFVQVPGGPDVADDYIAERCAPGDLVVTADIPLAARAVEKGATVVTHRGRHLDEDNVREALSVRDFHDGLRDVGVQTGGPAPYDDKVKQRFANTVDRWITSNG